MKLLSTNLSETFQEILEFYLENPNNILVFQSIFGKDGDTLILKYSGCCQFEFQLSSWEHDQFHFPYFSMEHCSAQVQINWSCLFLSFFFSFFSGEDSFKKSVIYGWNKSQLPQSYLQGYVVSSKGIPYKCQF